jgi:hypothetical protein
MSDHEPARDEEIVPAETPDNPGTDDGVGEHVLEGMGHDGVHRMGGEFAELDPAGGGTDGQATRRSPEAE